MKNVKNVKVLFFLLLLLLFTFSKIDLNVIEKSNEDDIKNTQPISIELSGYWTEVSVDIDDTAPYEFGSITWAVAAAGKPWCSGSGTLNDPYIVENVTFRNPGGGRAIRIWDSGVYFKFKNVTVKDSVWDQAFQLRNVTRGRLENVTISNCGGYGLYLENSDNNTISNTTLDDSDLYLYQSANNTLYDNKFLKNGLWIEGSREDMISNNINKSNLVNGKPLYFYANETGLSKDNFTNAGQIFIINCTNVNASYGNIYNTSTGVVVRDSSLIEISEFNISSVKYGIYTKDCVNITVSQNKIFDTSVTSFRAFYCINTNTSSFHNNTIVDSDGPSFDVDNSYLTSVENNTLRNIAGNINIDNCEYINVSKNVLYNSGGIFLQDSNFSLLYKNDISYTGTGISINDQSRNTTILGNLITKTTYAAINLDADSTIIKSNIFRELSSSWGIIIYSSYNKIYSNEFSNNDAYSIYITSSFGTPTANDVYNNTAFNNKETVLWISDSDWNIVRENRIYDNDFYAVYIGDSDFTTIENNTLIRNGWGGIGLRDSNSNTIINNQIVENKYNGIWLLRSDSNQITYNNLNYNDYSGISIDGSDLNTFSYNNCSYNNGSGIWAQEASTNTITFNLIMYNDQWGIFLKENTSYNILYGNDMIFNRMGCIYNGNETNSIGDNFCIAIPFYWVWAAIGINLIIGGIVTLIVNFKWIKSKLKRGSKKVKSV